MKTQLLHQFYKLLGFHPAKQGFFRANQVRGVWSQHKPREVKYMFTRVRTVLENAKHKNFRESKDWRTSIVAFIPTEKFNRELNCWLPHKHRRLNNQDIMNFFERNACYRKRYWSSEERLRRIIVTGDDGLEEFKKKAR